MSMLEFTIRCVSWEDPEVLVLDTHQIEREIREAGGMSAAEALLLCSRIATLARASGQLMSRVGAAESKLETAHSEVRTALKLLDDDDPNGAYVALSDLLKELR